MDYSIAILLPNTLTYETTRQLLKKHNWDYPLYRTAQSDALEISKGLIANGTRLIISTGATYNYLNEHLDIPLLELPFSGLEAALAIKKALSYSKRIVHIGVPTLFHYLQKSLEVLGISKDKIHFCELTNRHSTEELVLDMLSQGYEVFIGGYVAVTLARQYGKQGIEINVDEMVIETTILNAQSMLREILEQEEKNQLEQAILKTTSDGILAVDNDGIVVIANPAAERIISSDLVGQKLEAALAENHIIDIDSTTVNQLDMQQEYTPVILKKAPILVDNKKTGDVISVKLVSEIHELQYKTRRDLFLQGLWAEHTFDSIKGTSKAISLTKEKAKIYAKYDSPVLISGETGTGKELFAQSIHNASRRKMHPWVPVNCASLPENLIESELFGYEKGAFTGANKDGKVGFFELADGGTIFFDEISEIPIPVQSKLLRVIQEGDVIRVGGDKIIHVDVRIICASNKDLLQLIREKKFKEDLYYRLCVLEIKLPPLRERRGDIEGLIHYLLKKFSKQHGKNVTGIEPEALAVIRALPLLGNVRELSNLVERTVIFANEETITLRLLQELILPELQTQDMPDTDVLPPKKPAQSGNLKEAEREMILETLQQTGGNKAAAARALGIDPSTLWRKLKKYEIKL
ncbi:MAG: sigma 54-interacting transcriptional regulator [Firmicutes bacterium]|nr:sigma 54-interacting transcriptional regulator [Bacillota bacterium]